MADLKIRRGTQAQLPALGLGEPGFTTDTKKLYIGDGIGNNLIGPNGGSSSTYLALTDTETTYSGQAGRYPTVSADETTLEFGTMEWDPTAPLIPETAISGTYLINFECGRLLIGATGNKPDLVYNGPVAGLAFDATKVESCYGVFKIPYAWNTDSDVNVTINFMTDVAQTGTKICAWDIHYHTYANGELYSDKTTTESHVHATLPENVGAGTYLTATLQMTGDDVNNPMARGDMVAFQFFRAGDDTEHDTMIGDAVLLSLIFELQVGQRMEEN